MALSILKNRYIQYTIIGIFTVLSFVGSAQLSQLNSGFLQSLTQQVGIAGILWYIGLLIASVVVSPVSTGFLLPVAANSWGPFLAAIFSIIGWGSGAIIAFVIARKYGERLVGHFGPVKKMRAVEAAIPRKNVFLYVVLLRVAFPVELLSYALGIFSSMKFWPYFFSTLIGITPFSFLFSYASVSNVWIQSAVALLWVMAFISGSYYVYVRTVAKAKKYEL